MPELWLDADSFITPKRGPYSFELVPGFWAFLQQKAKEGIIGSSLLVYDELQNGSEDDLVKWANS